MKKTNPLVRAAAWSAAAILSLNTAFADGKVAPPEPIEDGPVVQIALLLDTSNSMDGLIEQAKSQLWKVVNEFIGAEQGGKTPVVQVALFEYGNNGLNKQQNWIRQIQPLTRDLDKISEELFALTTNGGDEYCGAVIERAVQDLAWDDSSETFKTIFIAGNEPFTQGPVDAAKACKAAIGKGVIVNTVHCGNEQAGISGKWKMGALLADGSFMTIDQNRVVPHVDAPQDKKIAEWNVKLNATYLAYGTRGAALKGNQSVQDANAEGVQADALVQRAATKASSNYWNGHWDLVDAAKKKDFKIEDIKTEDLPEDMRKMKMEERKAHIVKMAKERETIQKQILALSKERKDFVAEALEEAGEADTLDSAIIKTIRTQASTKSITFK